MAATAPSNADLIAAPEPVVNKTRFAVGELFKVGIYVPVLLIPWPDFLGIIMFLAVVIGSMMFNFYPGTVFEFGWCIDSVWSTRTRKSYVVYAVRSVVNLILIVIGLIFWTFVIMTYAPEAITKEKVKTEVVLTKIEAKMGYFAIIYSIITLMIGYSFFRFIMNVYGLIIALAAERFGEDAVWIGSLLMFLLFIVI